MILEVAILDVKPSRVNEFETAFQTASSIIAYIVMVANEGYIPGRVNFSVKTASGINVLDFLKKVDLSPGEGSYGHGHNSASGGSLPVERWNELLTSLGFETKAF